MADDDDRPVTARELAQARAEWVAGLDEIRQGQKALLDANTARERDDARDQLDDAEDDLSDTAKKLGVSEKDLRESIAASKRAKIRADLEPIVREVIDEIVAGNAGNDNDDDDDANDDDATDDDAEADKKPKGKKPAADPPATDPPADPPADKTPLKEHWSERGVTGILR